MGLGPKYHFLGSNKFAKKIFQAPLPLWERHFWFVRPNNLYNYVIHMIKLKVKKPLYYAQHVLSLEKQIKG